MNIGKPTRTHSGSTSNERPTISGIAALTMMLMVTSCGPSVVHNPLLLCVKEAGGGELAVGQPQYLKDLLGRDDLTSEQIAAAVEYLSKHPELVPQVGKIVSDEVRGLNYDSSEEDVACVAALLNGFSKNGPVSAAILDNLSADNLIQFVSLAGALAYRGNATSSAGLANGLRSVFRTGEPEMTEAASRQFARDIVSYLRGDRMGTLQPGNDPYALSYLLRDSKLSTPFLGELGNELDAFERSFGQTGYTWYQMGSMAYGGGWFFEESDREGAFDPMASYMSALGLNGEASLQFFTGTGAEDDTGYLSDAEVEDRQEYWIERRLWGHDDFNGLLAALDSATTSTGNLDNLEATKLVSTSFEMLVNRTQGENDAGHPIGFGTDDEKILPGTLGDDASRHLAHIFGTYMESVDYHINGLVPDVRSHIGATTTFDRNDFSGPLTTPRFNKNDLALLVKAGLSSDEGFAAFRQAVTNYQDVHIAQVIQNHYRTKVFDEATNYDAKLEAFFMNNLGEVKIADGLDKDNQIKVWLGLGSDLAGEIPFGKIPGVGPVVGFLAGQGLDASQDALTEYLAHYEKDAGNDATELAEMALDNRRNSIIGALYDNGKISRHEVDEQAAVLKIPSTDVDRWFADGFPDSKTIRTDPGDLLSLVSALGEDRLDMNEYRQNYKDEFQRYFE